MFDISGVTSVLRIYLDQQAAVAGFGVEGAL